MPQVSDEMSRKVHPLFLYRSGKVTLAYNLINNQLCIETPGLQPQPPVAASYARSIYLMVCRRQWRRPLANGQSRLSTSCDFLPHSPEAQPFSRALTQDLYSKLRTCACLEPRTSALEAKSCTFSCRTGMTGAFTSLARSNPKCPSAGHRRRQQLSAVAVFRSRLPSQHALSPPQLRTLNGNPHPDWMYPKSGID